MTTNGTRVFNPVTDDGKARIWLYGSLGVLVLLLGWLGSSYLWPRTLTYAIEADSLVISTGSGDALEGSRIPLSRITSVTKEVLRGGTLRFGREKPGYCVGLFEFARFGEVWLYTTCGPRGVLIQGTGLTAPVVIAPADPDAFIQALHAVRVGPVPVARNSDGTGMVVAALAAALVVLGGGLVIAFAVAPRRLAYRIDGGTLAIGSLAGRREVGLAGARVRPHRPLEGARTSGLPLPGHVVGSYLLDAQPTSVYASRLGPGVLVESEGRIFLTPDDVEGFLAACEAGGATRAAQALR